MHLRETGGRRLTSGEESLTERMLFSIISLRSHTDSKKMTCTPLASNFSNKSFLLALSQLLAS